MAIPQWCLRILRRQRGRRLADPIRPAGDLDARPQWNPARLQPGRRFDAVAAAGPGRRWRLAVQGKRSRHRPSQHSSVQTRHVDGVSRWQQYPDRRRCFAALGRDGGRSGPRDSGTSPSDQNLQGRYQHGAPSPRQHVGRADQTVDRRLEQVASRASVQASRHARLVLLSALHP